MRTRDGVAYGIRQIRPPTGPLSAFVAGLSPDTKYRRFLHAVGNLSEKELTSFTDLDHRDADALVAVDDRGDLIGVARYGRGTDHPDVAEVAVTVADDWQGLGVGTTLLRRLAAAADRDGIHRFAASCFASNTEMINLFEELGTTRRTGYCSVSSSSRSSFRTCWAESPERLRAPTPRASIARPDRRRRRCRAHGRSRCWP